MTLLDIYTPSSQQLIRPLKYKPNSASSSVDEAWRDVPKHVNIFQKLLRRAAVSAQETLVRNSQPSHTTGMSHLSAGYIQRVK